MLNDSNIISQFLSVAIIHLFAVISPGPDFIVIAKQSLHSGRKSSIFTALGIGAGILIHVSYCLMGVQFIASKSEYILKIIKIIGALYLIYDGLSTMTQKNTLNISGLSNSLSFKGSFYLGFFTNILNPKATMFFLSLYSIIIKHETTFIIQLIYGLWMAAITTLWFCCLSIFLTNPIILNKFYKFSYFISFFLGAILILFGIKLLY